MGAIAGPYVPTSVQLVDLFVRVMGVRRQPLEILLLHLPGAAGTLRAAATTAASQHFLNHRDKNKKNKESYLMRN